MQLPIEIDSLIRMSTSILETELIKGTRQVSQHLTKG